MGFKKRVAWGIFSGGSAALDVFFVWSRKSGGSFSFSGFYCGELHFVYLFCGLYHCLSGFFSGLGSLGSL